MHPSRTALSPLRSTLRNIPDMWRALNYTYSWSSLDYIYTEDTITRLSVWYAGEPVFNLFKTGRGGLHCYGIKYHLIQHTKETWQ